MIIYPTIELLDGRCVSLFRGRLDEPQIWHVDPVEKARSFAEAGAEWMHVTDFEGIRGHSVHRDLLIEIIRAAGIPVQLGGGFRTMEEIEEWIDLGAGRIVLGTMAVQNPDLVKRAAKYYPDQIVLAVDVQDGLVMSDGWRAQSTFDPAEFIAAFDDDPLAAIIVTDIDAKLDAAEPSLALVTRIADAARAPVIARGLSRSIDDIARLKYVPHVSGALIGRALFSKDIDLAEALEVARPDTEPRAQFI